MYRWETAQKIYLTGGTLTVHLSRDFFHNCLTQEPITHTHPEYELQYVKSGEVLLSSGGEAIRCKAKSILIIPPFCRHTVTRATSDAITCTLLFTPSAGYTPDAVYSAVCRSKPLCFPDSYNADARLTRIKSILFSDTPASIDIIRGELTLLFAELATEELNQTNAHTDAIDENRAARIEIYLAECYGSPDCSCRNLAGIMGLSERQVHRLCIEYYGCPFRELLHIRRMEIAKHRLGLGTNSVTEIAEQLGYASLASFSAAYKRYYGHSPNKDT